MAKSNLLQQVREEIRRFNYSHRIEQAYLNWIKRYVHFHDLQHPAESIGKHIAEFLSHLANKRNVAASTQHQVFCAIVFLYEEVLGQSMPHPNQWTHEPQRLPIILTLREIDHIFQRLEGVPLMIAKLLYYAGLDISEATRIRVQDVDFSCDQLTVGNSNRGKGRIVMLPLIINEKLQKQIQKVKFLFQKDMKRGYGGSVLPKRLATKHPNFAKELDWQYLFPSFKITKDSQSGLNYRHHIPDTFIRMAIHQAAEQASIFKPINSRILCRSFVWHLLHNEYDIQTIQALFGYRDIHH
jgi:integron integrase